MLLDPQRVEALARFEDRYELRRKLWHDGPYGGWLAFDRLLEREVHLGVEHRWVHEPGAESEFFRAIRIAARLRHPNIKPIYELGIDPEGLCFFTSPMIAGARDLGFLLRSRDQGESGRIRPLDLGDLVGILLNACRALDHAHRRGILHLNVGPHSIEVGPEPQDVYLTEWTDARDVAGCESPASFHPGPVGIFGVVNYMAPEQVDPKRGDPSVATDVHGIGGALYLVLYDTPPNRPPGTSSSPESLRLALQPKRPRPLRPGLLPPGTSEKLEARRSLQSLERICLHALELDPARRHPGMPALIRELGDWLDSHAAIAKAPPRRPWWSLAPRTVQAASETTPTRPPP